MFIKNYSINTGINARGYNGYNPTWFGFSYGSWLPKFSSNGGNKHQVRDYNFRWLFFHTSFTIWPKGIK